MQITKEISISADFKIVTDILNHHGPKHKMLVIGYVGWGPGQLMDEIKKDDWLVLPDKLEEDSISSNFKLIFQEDNFYKWNKSLKLSGITLSTYISLSGNAWGAIYFYR